VGGHHWYLGGRVCQSSPVGCGPMPTPSFSSADLASLPLKLQICSELLALRDRRTQVGFDACNSDSDSGRRPRVWALVQMSFSPLKQGPETRRWKSMAGRHEPLGARRHEPLGAGRHEPLGASTCFLECQLSGMSANVNLPGGDPCGRHQRRSPGRPRPSRSSAEPTCAPEPI